MSKHITLPRLNQLAASIAVVVGGLAFLPAAYAAPAAGTNISNVATASYLDATNTSRTVTSNSVSTTVLQVGSFTLTSNQTATANANGQVSLSHTLTNTGNGNDTFTVNLVNVAGDNYDFNNISIYLDANKDGNPDNTTDIKGTTINVGAGQSVGLIVVATTANSATVGQVGNLNVTATNVYSATPAGGNTTATTATNTDSVTITAGAVIQVTKSASVSSINPTGSVADRTVEYTLTYKNVGNSAATNVTLKDILPAGVTYVAGSGVWSGSATARTDVAADESGAAYDITTGTVNFVLGTVAPNTTGTLKFKVTVNANTPAGSIANTATFDPDGANNGVAEQPTNTAIVTVNSIYTGTINDSLADAFADGVTPSAPVGTKNDQLTATTTQGTPVSFGLGAGEPIVIHNTGNVVETFNISVNKAALPSGSIVELLKADGVTPLTDTNGDPAVDSGPLAAGAAQQIVVRVTLPSGYTGPIPNGGLNTIVTVTPVNNATAVDTLTLSITNITAAKVDLSNGAGNEDGIANDTPNAGEGAYVAGDTIDTKTVAPGQSVTFPLAITNIGTNADNYNLTSNLPAGWTVNYYTSNAAGVCSTNQVVNTGNIAANTTGYLCATVTAPANATPADSRDVVFTVTSAGTGLADSIKDRINVSEVRNLSFNPDRQGQVAPGGTVTYVHTLTNNGNVTEGFGANTLPFTIAHAGNLSTNTSVYIDVNNNGIAEANELVTGTDLTAVLAGTAGGAGLQPGEAVTVLVKVQASSSATAGQADDLTFAITPTAGAAVQVIDKTTVNLGQVRLTKQQALDTNCDGIADGAYGSALLQAKPGTCISYQISAVNDGNAPVTSVVISDTVPSYTTLNTTVAPTLIPSSAGAVTVTGNALASAAFNLAPAAKVDLQFTVKIDN